MDTTLEQTGFSRASPTDARTALPAADVAAPMSPTPLRLSVLGGAILALLALLVVAGSAPEQPGLASVRQAEAHFAAAEFTAADAAFQAAEAQLTPDAYSRQRRAALYLRWNRPAEGLALLESLPDADPLLRLELLAAAGDWATLETVARQYLELAPGASQAHAHLTRALLQQRRCAEAEVAADAWAGRAPGTETALTAATLHFIHQREAADAGLCTLDEEMCRIVRACPASGLCTRQLGEALLRRQQPALAACSLSRAVADAPQDARAQAWLGAALEQLGDTTAALSRYQQATELAPDDPLGWLLLGMARLKLQETETAREALLRAQALDPANPAPCLAVAAALAAEGAYGGVPTWTAAALERAPADVSLWKAVARFYLARNLTLEGEPLHAAEGAVQLAPQDAEAWTLLGWAHFNAGDYTAAREALETALQYDAQSAEAYHFLGATLRALNHHAEADAAFTRAADLGYRQ